MTAPETRRPSPMVPEKRNRARVNETLVAECKAAQLRVSELEDDLKIANERGDGWRELVREDAVRIEELRARVAELERALLAADLEP